MKHLLLAGLICVASTSTASAASQFCEFTKWRGAPDEIAQSWIGTGFRLSGKDSQKQLSIIFDDKETGALEVKTKTNSSFTTYFFSKRAKQRAGFNRNMRFSFRAYDSGKCKAFGEVKGFPLLEATGTLR